MRWTSPLLFCATGLLSALAAGGGTITAVPLPNPQIPGFTFPESEATLLGWSYEVGNNTSGAATAFANLNLHGWGLWAALTMQTSQVDDGERLRVFETWYTPQEVDQIPSKSTVAALPLLKRQRAVLRNFAQFEHGVDPQVRLANTATNGNQTVFGYVKFDPTAAAHVVTQNLLSAATLNQLMQDGAQQIPVFPNTALTLKSAFLIITAQTLVDGRYYRLNAWTGPPQTPQPWGPERWPGVVWIDIRGGGSGNGQVDLNASTDGSSRTAATTYPVSSMIYHLVTPTEAQQFNQDQPGQNVVAGDYAILVAMHVAGREITRWTWQTFWWSPMPSNPQLPSSTEIAALRPATLTGAARNYAMALSYDMITPGQPNVGGENAGLGVYVYNPYLEAVFTAANLPDSLPGKDPFGRPAANNVGVACNCMSCHMRANYNPNNLATAPRYSGSRYTSMDDPQFSGTLQVDLLWSIDELAR
jgi:hypothetical protein